MAELRNAAATPLPIGGLLSDRPYDEVARGLAGVIEAAREMGSSLADPFMTMSFLALEVVQALKISNKGLVDVDRFEIVPLREPAET